ncbi:LysM domain-containing protein [Cladorrhinum samala]|uniref:LysM domain-containing protein n=1 Tax=Cladorrhinum samala TaxID=585594 RepID=A0AAV9I244_9PEZI|nr:LysM domain-containing protein [Cladorrhinum samala]
MSLAGLLLAAAVGLARAQTASTPPAPTFTGSPSNCNKWYVIESGDNCNTVETKFGIAHADFIAWNPAVPNDCLANFWLGQAYCVGVRLWEPTPPGPTFTGSPSNCNRWYQIASGDTCTTVVAKFGITHAEFTAWNPAVSSDCTANFWLGQSYCVGTGVVTVVSTLSSSTTPSLSSTTSRTATSLPPYSTRYPITSTTLIEPTFSTEWPPTKTQAGQPAYCNNWHLVLPGDTCGLIIGQYSTWMSRDDFFAWNPAISTSCSGLYTYYWVCVGIQPQVQLSLPYITGNATLSLPPTYALTSTSRPTQPYMAIPSPTQGPIPTNCKGWYLAQGDDNCRSILSVYTFVTETEFFAWNPSLNNNCDGLLDGYWYCVLVQEPGADLPFPPTVTTTPSPRPTGVIGTCTGWYFATGDDTCAFIATIFGTFSEAQFKAWNPSVGADCSRIETYKYYCISVPGTPTTRSVPLVLETSPPAEMMPTQAGIAEDCDDWWLVSRSDTCDELVRWNGISRDKFLQWNPALGAKCQGLEAGWYVCVGISASGTGGTSATSSSVTSTSSGGAAQSTTTSSSAASSTVSAMPTPTPTQAGMVAGCKEFYFVQGGDGCWSIANDHAISLALFYTWNPAVNEGGECAGLWLNVYVCVGI